MDSNRDDSTTFLRVEECFSQDSSQPELPYSQPISGINIEVLDLFVREGESDIFLISQCTIPIYLGQSAHMNFIAEGYHHQFSLHNGSMAVIPPKVSMQCWWDRPVNFLYLYVEPWLLFQRAEELFKGNNIFEVVPQLTPIEDRFIQQIGLAMKHEIEAQSSLVYLQSISDTLAIHLLHKHTTQSKPYPKYQGGLSPFKLKQVTDFIHDSLDRDMSLDELAQVTRLSRSHFSRAFKQSMGISPHQYIIQQRVEKAKRLLLQGKLAIADVATACGFNHQSHLNRHFKRLTGVTPRAVLKG